MAELNTLLERSRVPAWRVVIPAIAFAATFAALSLSQFLLALALGVLTAVVLFFSIPRDSWRSGMETNYISDADLKASQPWINFLIFTAFYIGMQIIFAQTEGAIKALATAALTFGAFMWIYRRQTAVDSRVVKQRLATAVESAPPVSQELIAAAFPHQDLIRTLITAGAFSGTRARVWKLAEVLKMDTHELYADILALRREGLVEVSTLDSGEDTTRHLVNLTPSGVAIPEVR